MKKAIFFVAVSAFVGFMAMGSIVAADDVVPGQYGQSDASVMGVGQTMMQMGAHARTLTNATNLASGAGSSRSDTGPINGDYQFGSSQTEQSWKQWKSVEDAGVVVGLVPGDCRGDNSDDSYRKQMNQNRNGYMVEKLVSQTDCEVDHPTIK
ncbi:MAG: hypothetical protein H8E42_01430 [Nitrospinae bacterium]|nr:hypothetical protein [Nitrospinota bacterium]MBL7019827.1 hypothetical protein [Nitrospinaceae bacterium]